MAYGENYFMSLQRQDSSRQKLIYTGGKANQRKRNQKLGALWRFSTLSSYLKRVRWQDRTHAAVVSHVTSLLLSEGWRANTPCSAHSRRKRGCIMLILSDGSIYGIVASTWPVTNRVGRLPAVQRLHPPLLFWSNLYV